MQAAQLYSAAFQCQTTDTSRSSSTSQPSFGASLCSTVTAQQASSFAKESLTSLTNNPLRRTTPRATTLLVSLTIKRSPSVQPQQAVRTVDFQQPTRVAGTRSMFRLARTVLWALLVVHPTTVTSALHVQRVLSQAPLLSHGRPRSAALTFALPRSTSSKPSLMLALAA